MCGAYLAVDHSSVYGGYPKLFLLFFSIIMSLSPFLKPSFLIHILVSFCLCFLHLDLFKFCCQLFPAWKPCLSIFNSQWILFNSNQRDLITCLCPYRLTVYSYHFLLFLLYYPWPYILYAWLFSSNVANIFNIAHHVFCNLFWKICPLFGQILITSLKCSRVSFSPCSYSEKMRWEQG